MAWNRWNLLGLYYLTINSTHYVKTHCVTQYKKAFDKFTLLVEVTEHVGHKKSISNERKTRYKEISKRGKLLHIVRAMREIS